MNYALFAVGLMIGLAGVTIAFVEFGMPFARPIGIALMLAGAYVIRLSKRNAQTPKRSEQVHDQAFLNRAPKRLNIIVWFMVGASVIAAGIFFGCMVYYNYLWAAYGFIVSMGILALLVAYVVGSTVWRAFNR